MENLRLPEDFPLNQSIGSVSMFNPTLVFPRWPKADLFLSKASAEALRQTETITQGLGPGHPTPE